jgi:hypothetical protein
MIARNAISFVFVAGRAGKSEFAVDNRDFLPIGCGRRSGSFVNSDVFLFHC